MCRKGIRKREKAGNVASCTRSNVTTGGTLVPSAMEHSSSDSGHAMLRRRASIYPGLRRHAKARKKKRKPRALHHTIMKKHFSLKTTLEMQEIKLMVSNRNSVLVGKMCMIRYIKADCMAKTYLRATQLHALTCVSLHHVPTSTVHSAPSAGGPASQIQDGTCPLTTAYARVSGDLFYGYLLKLLLVL